MKEQVRSGGTLLTHCESNGMRDGYKDLIFIAFYFVRDC